MRKRKAGQTEKGIYITCSIYSKGTAFPHQGDTISVLTIYSVLHLYKLALQYNEHRLLFVSVSAAWSPYLAVRFVKSKFQRTKSKFNLKNLR